LLPALVVGLCYPITGTTGTRLGAGDLLVHLPQVSRAFVTVTRDEALWRTVLARSGHRELQAYSGGGGGGGSGGGSSGSDDNVDARRALPLTLHQIQRCCIFYDRRPNRDGSVDVLAPRQLARGIQLLAYVKWEGISN
jgi:hypothetical protein